MHVRLAQFIKADFIQSNHLLLEWGPGAGKTQYESGGMVRLGDGEIMLNWKSECYTPLTYFMCSHTNRDGILNNGHVHCFTKERSQEAFLHDKKGIKVMTSTLKFTHFIALIRRTIRIFLLAKVKDLKNVLKTVQRVEHAT